MSYKKLETHKFIKVNRCKEKDMVHYDTFFNFAQILAFYVAFKQLSKLKKKITYELCVCRCVRNII